MALARDDAVFERLRRRPENAAVLDAVERSSVHGDLGEVLFGYAKITRLEVHPVATADFPALVATTAGGDLVVAAAHGMRELLVRAGDEPPDGARLGQARVVALGPSWWQVNPFDRDVSSPDIAAELPRWFHAAAALA